MGRYNRHRTLSASTSPATDPEQPHSPPAMGSVAASSRRANPYRRARKVLSTTFAQASAFQSPNQSPRSLSSTSTLSNEQTGRLSAATATPLNAQSGADEVEGYGTRLSPSSLSPSQARSPSTLAMAASPNVVQNGQTVGAIAAPSSSATPPSLPHDGCPFAGAAAATQSSQYEQPITSDEPARDLDPSILAIVSALGPVPSGWSIAVAEPFHTFDKAAFSGSDLPDTLEADVRARCLAFLENPRVLRVTENTPSAVGLPCLSACVCPICGTIVKDNWVPSRSGGFRRQIRTESLKEHLGMRHHLLRRVRCPVQEWSGCQCKGYCKAHRLLNHFSDNIACLAQVSRLLAARDSSSSQVLSTVQWALGSDWPRALDELVSAAMRSSGRSTVDPSAQIDRVRQLVVFRVAKARKVTVEVIEQAIVTYMKQVQLAASSPGIGNGGLRISAAQEGTSDSAVASPMAFEVPAVPSTASPAQAAQFQQPPRSSTLDSLLAPPANSSNASTVSRSPLLLVTPAPSIFNDAFFDQFQLQPQVPMSPTTSDGASNWSQGTSTPASAGAVPDALSFAVSSSTPSSLLPMDPFADILGAQRQQQQQQQQAHAFDHMFDSLGLYSTIPYQSMVSTSSHLPDSTASAQQSTHPLASPVGLDTLPSFFGHLQSTTTVSRPSQSTASTPGFVLPIALDTRNAPIGQHQMFLAPPSNPHTPVQSPIQPPAPPVMLEVPDWVQAHIPASVSPAASPAASPIVFSVASPNVASIASPGGMTTGLTPLMDQHLRLTGMSSPAISPSLMATPHSQFLGSQWSAAIGGVVSSTVHSPLISTGPPIPHASTTNGPTPFPTPFDASFLQSSSKCLLPQVTTPHSSSSQSPNVTHPPPQTRTLHFVPTPDNMLVDGVYVGPVGPSVAATAAAAPGSGQGGNHGWSATSMRFTTVADALDMHYGHTRS